jgi:peptidoglycan biosynthesis protein MviN/MurJ (putative lipid II flippase)
MTEEPAGGAGRSAVITAVAQLVAMLAGALLAVLAAVRFGNDARTDGFFAAYSLYSVGVIFAQAARTSIVAKIVEPGAFDRYLGGVLLVIGLFGVVLGGLGHVVADLLTAGREESRETARTALLILWPAVAGQLVAGLTAARLATRGDFSTPAFAFGGGGAVSIPAFLLLEPALGIDALAVAILLGSLVTAAVLGVAVARSGWRVDARRALAPRAGAGAARVMALGALPFLLGHVGFVFTLAVASRIGEGIVTVYSYSFAAVGIVMALLGSVPAIILAGPLATTWDRRPESLLPHHRAVWLTGLLLLVPILAGGWLLGDDVARLVLRRFTGGEAQLTVDLFLLSAPVVAWSVAVSLPTTALFTLGRYQAAAAVAAATLAIQLAVLVLAAQRDSEYLMASAVAISGAVSVLLYLGVFSRDYLRRAGPPLALGLARVGGVGAVAFVLPGLLLPGGAAFVVGTVLFVAAVATLLAEERELGGRLLALARRRL